MRKSRSSWGTTARDSLVQPMYGAKHGEKMAIKAAPLRHFSATTLLSALPFAIWTVKRASVSLGDGPQNPSSCSVAHLCASKRHDSISGRSENRRNAYG